MTIRDLLTHTGGLPAWLPLYSAYPTVEERLAAVLAVEPDAPSPGEAYVYSDLGLITLGLVVEEVTGTTAGLGDRPRHHPPAADVGHDVQPAGATGRPDRRHRGAALGRRGR